MDGYETERPRRVGTLAFLMLRDAFLELAKAHGDRDGNDTQVVLADIKAGIVFTMQDIITARPDLIQSNMLIDSVASVRAVLTKAEALVSARRFGIGCNSNEPAERRDGDAGDHSQTIL